AASTSAAVRANSTATPVSLPVSRMRETKNRSLTTASTGLAARAPAPGLAASEPTDDSGSRHPVGERRGGAALAPPDVDSIGLFTGAEPVLVPLGDVGERREAAHPVQIHHAVQVVALVLDDAREEVLGDQAHRLRVAVVALEPDRAAARQRDTEVGGAEASDFQDRHGVPDSSTRLRRLDLSHLAHTLRERHARRSR